MLVKMDGPSAKKSTSFETLVIQNIENINDLKIKLNEIISCGKNYEYDVSSCLKTLLKSSDHAIVLLAVQAISELAKCETKRDTYSHTDVIEPILSMLNKEVTFEKIELVKQCCRALGNLCCDCDNSRQILLDLNGVVILSNILDMAVKGNTLQQNEIKLFTCKTLLNYAIGGRKYSESLAKGDVIELAKKILSMESEKEYMEDDLVSTVLLILSVINDNDPEILYDVEVNLAVVKVLKETTNVEVSELCLEHLHTQAEHDSVKTLLAKEGRINLVCLRLEQLVQKQETGDFSSEDSEIDAIMKQACDLIIIVLTGDEAMRILYDNGDGEVYKIMVSWLDSSNYQLLTTAVLAVGNFARCDDYCIQMMDRKIFDKLLDIFELHREPGEQQPGEQPGAAQASRLQHAALAALRNLLVPARNKARAGARAAELLVGALGAVRDHHVAYKLLAAVRMLLDGQEEVARRLASSAEALAGAARWGGAEHAGAAGEAPRLLAWAVRLLPAHPLLRRVVETEGCVACLVSMLVASHSVMQSEALLALTLLAGADAAALARRLAAADAGRHAAVLLDANCAKMPAPVAANLVAFLEATAPQPAARASFGAAGVAAALRRFVAARHDLAEPLAARAERLAAALDA